MVFPTGNATDELMGYRVPLIRTCTVQAGTPQVVAFGDAIVTLVPVGLVELTVLLAGAVIVGGGATVMLVGDVAFWAQKRSDVCLVFSRS